MGGSDRIIAQAGSYCANVYSLGLKFTKIGLPSRRNFELPEAKVMLHRGVGTSCRVLISSFNFEFQVCEGF